MSLIERYKLAFDISPVPMLLVDAAGKIMLANSDFLKLFEYETGELDGMNVEVLVPDQLRSHHPELRSAYFKVPTKRSMGEGRDLHGVTKSGNVVPLELGLEPIVDGPQTLALVAAIDIRQRKAHEKRMIQAMDAAASAMVMVDRTGSIVFVNRAACDLFGYDEISLLGQRIEMLVPQNVRRTHTVFVSGYMSDRSVRPMGNDRALFASHKSGRQIPVEITLTPVETPEETLVMSTIIDLSERVAAADTLLRKNTELANLNSELSQFAYSTSHDLRAPLATITGLMAFCIEDLADGNVDEVRENLDRALDISKRSTQKVESLLQIARVTHDAIPAEEINLNVMLGEIWTDLTANKSTSQLKLELEHATTIRLVPTKLKIILENLLSNALRYADPHKPSHVIRVFCANKENKLEIGVADNGLGIRPENLDKVFVMFQRLDTLSNDGLGLTLIKKHIDHMGGTIEVQSVFGEGAEFVIRLPQGERK